MKYPIHILLALTLLFGLAVQSPAAANPFIKTNWGSSPAEVMNIAGLPAFSKVDFKAKKTNFLAYHQTISACNFIFYYLFNDNQLYQVRLKLKEEPWNPGLVDLSNTINSMLEHALTINTNDGLSETMVKKRPQEGQPYASSVWWYTTETFALTVIDAGTPQGQMVFEVLLADAANPANTALIDGYREITAPVKIQNEAQSQNAENFSPSAAMPTKSSFKAVIMDEIQALASGSLNNLLRDAAILLAVIILAVLAVILLRKKRAARTEHQLTEDKAALRSLQKNTTADSGKYAAKATAANQNSDKTSAKTAMPKVMPATIRSIQKPLPSVPLKKTSGGHVLHATKTMLKTATVTTPPITAFDATDDDKFIPGQKAACNTPDPKPVAAPTPQNSLPQGRRQLRMVTASRSNSGKGSKLSFKK